MLKYAFVVLQKRPDEIDRKAANMYTFALILWEIGTTNIPFGGMSSMSAGLKVIKLSYTLYIYSSHICMSIDCPGECPPCHTLIY